MKQYLMASNLLNPTNFQLLDKNPFVANLIFVRPMYNWWDNFIVSSTESLVLFLFFQKKVLIFSLLSLIHVAIIIKPVGKLW